MLTAKNIMTRDVITVQDETSVAELAKLITSHNISGVPVLSETGDLIAVVTESDLIDQSKKLHIPTVITILDSVFYLENPDKMESEMKKMAGTKVADICSSSVTTITPDTPLDEIATIMAEKSIHTLPVLDNSKLVGVIGKKDIIKTLMDS
jgi:CBS-domain-containing membrane protein